MKLKYVTITGAADGVDPVELYKLSRMYPMVEWAILLSPTKAGKHPRYPSNEWISELRKIHDFDKEEVMYPLSKPTMNLAAHLCGKTMRDFMVGITEDGFDPSWCEQHGLTENQYNDMFNRTQVNFNAFREGYTKEQIMAMIDGWNTTMGRNIITQHNDNNSWICEYIQRYEDDVYRPHQILHDASGGRGVGPSKWEPPVAGLLNGYAGGINPDNVIEVCEELDHLIPEGYIWIDMESGVRDDDDKFDMTKVQYVLREVSSYMYGMN